MADQGPIPQGLESRACVLTLFMESFVRLFVSPGYMQVGDLSAKWAGDKAQWPSAFVA